MKKYFRDVSNLISFVIALIPTILFYIFKPSTSVPFAVFAVLLSVSLALLWLSVKLYLDLRYAERKPIIELLPCQDGFCLCRSNDMLPLGAIVSFYQVSGNYEHLIGLGCVEVINSQGIVQIKPLSPENGSTEPLYDQIEKSINSIVIRPIVTRSTLPMIQGLI